MSSLAFEGRNAYGLTARAYEFTRLSEQPYSPPPIDDLDTALKQAFPDIYERHLIWLFLDAFENYGEWYAITWPFIDLSISSWLRKRSRQFNWNVLIFLFTLGFVNRFERGILKEIVFEYTWIRFIRKQLNAAMQRLIERQLLIGKIAIVDEMEIGIYEPTNALSAHLVTTT